MRAQTTDDRASDAQTALLARAGPVAAAAGTGLGLLAMTPCHQLTSVASPLVS